MPLKKVPIRNAVREFPGGTFNTLVDLAKGNAPHYHDVNEIDFRGKAVRAKNVSGQDIPRGGILRITDASDLTHSIALRVNKPNNTFQQLYAVALKAIAVDKRGPCTLFEPVRALYDTSDGTPTNGQIWGPINGQWHLKKNRPGFFVCGAPADGLVTVIQTQAESILRATLNADLLRGGTAPATLAVGGTTITVTDWSFIPNGHYLSQNTRVFVKSEGSDYYVIAAQNCPVPT